MACHRSRDLLQCAKVHYAGHMALPHSLGRTVRPVNHRHLKVFSEGVAAQQSVNQSAILSPSGPQPHLPASRLLPLTFSRPRSRHQESDHPAHLFHSNHFTCQDEVLPRTPLVSRFVCLVSVVLVSKYTTVTMAWHCPTVWYVQNARRCTRAEVSRRS